MNSNNDKSERERRLDEVVTAYLKHIEAGQAPNHSEWLGRYPDLADDLAAFFAAQDQMKHLAAPLRAQAPAVQIDAPTEASAQSHGTDAAHPSLGKIRYFGDYELLAEIARGGMGVVYKARQVKLKRIVAVKMILAGELAHQTDVERFHAEARAAANLHHPNIVAIHEVGQHNGQHYFSMDYVDGESLAQRIARGPLPPREAATLMKKVAEAVAFAHVDGVIHRDLKPANILVDSKGEPHVTDFGLAKRVQGEPGASTTGERGPASGTELTQTGQVLGTASYMPPEQASGKTKEVGACSHVYSLGAVLYCALTGRPPFQAASTLDTLMQVINQEPARPRALDSAIPRDLETICLKCLDKDPKQRYASAQELADELQRFLNGEPIVARPIGPVSRAWRWCKRNPTVAGMSAALVLALVGGFVTSWTKYLQAKEADRQAHHEASVSAGLTIQANELANEKGILALQAKEQERLTRRYLYSAHMNLAYEAWKSGNVLRMVELLHQHKPGADEDNLPSFEWGYLERECNRQRRSFELALASPVDKANTFTVSPDGRWIAFGTLRHVYAYRGADLSTFNAIQLWDVAAGKMRHTFVGEVERKTNIELPNLMFEELVFSPDSSLFATVTFDLPSTAGGVENARSPRVTVYELATLKRRAVIPLPRFVLGDCIAISPDNKTLVAGMTEHGDKVKFPYTLMTWDLPVSEQTPAGPGRILRQRAPSFTGLDNDGFPKFAFSADSKSLLWNLWADEGVTISDFAGGADRTWPLKGFSTSIKVSPDGKYVAAKRAGTNTHLLDAKTGKVLHEFNEGSGPDSIYPTAFSPDSKLIAVGNDMRMMIWDVETRKLVGEIRGHNDRIRAVGFGSDSKTVITVGNNKFTGKVEVRIWDANLRPGPDTIDFAANPLKRPDTPDPGTFSGASFSPDRKTFATLWDWSVGGPAPARILTLHDFSSGSLGKQLLQLKWDWKDKTISPPGFKPSQVTFSPDGKRLALSSGGAWDVKAIQLWRLEPGPEGLTATFERGFLAPQHDTNRQPMAVFSPDGTKLVYSAGPNPEERYCKADYLHVLELATGKKTMWPANTKPFFPHAAGLQAFWMEGIWEGSCNGIVFTSDGKRIISVHKHHVGPWTTRIIAWDAATGEILAVLESPVSLEHVQHPMALSKDDRMLATSNEDHSIFIWDVSEPTLREVGDELKRRAANPEQKPKEPAGKPSVTLRGHAAWVTALAFHPDGKTLASASADQTIRIWDLVTGEVRLTLEAHASASLQFTPDGKTLISADIRGEVKIWRASERKRFVTQTAHSRTARDRTAPGHRSPRRRR